MSAADKIVIIVFDGLRPDMIAGRMPRLEAFAAENLWFREARSVFPSVTRVATTSTATGAWPGRHGIINNAFHMPGLLPGAPIDTSDFAHLALMRERLDAIVTTQSLGQALAAQGKRMGAVHCGSAGAAFLINHDVARNGHWTFSVHGEAATQTPEAVARGIALCGGLPAMDVPKFDVVDYAGRVLRGLALGEDQPDVSLVWLPEPDTSFHYCQIGSEQSRAVMAAADAVFGMLVDHIRSGPGGARTAIIAMSDHGQISTTKEVDLGAQMNAAGLPAHHRPDKDTRIAITRGNMGELRMLSDDPALPGAAAQWLMGSDDIGMVFARDDLASAIPGALPMSLVHHTHERCPELYYVMRSDEGADAHGLPGRGAYTAGVPLGGGMHGGLNRHEMNTVLICDVPDGRRGAVDMTPAGLIDIAPTVLSLLGVGYQADGRVLPLFTPEAEAATDDVADAASGAFAQRLHRRAIGGRVYLDRGGRV
ncbi:MULTISPECIES: alkaline phosphatase family protein [Actibacterium]|uniref:Nucleotide pyrophosphatase n=1 Tax=Actibacterium naphthalenivorans TaxID=1614693 RepID=A0A840C8K4_9RHOB|nr:MULTISPECIES: alkaline phosphatase family protein [Actibacterium]ALG89043.1 nucleotide pyrophosphatase [Actibacterium sp. EMB200-NS6]MBB4021400.1 hypothetical protein [Actibacterium naphthalenivorans]